MSFDLGPVARDLNLDPGKVERTVALLDEGNTVPFITRYRKDQTGGLDEEQIRAIHEAVAQQRALQERKQKILRSIEAQGKLTPELAEAIQQTNHPKRLEDLYLPYKPKKQTLATAAREKGLEPLALEVLNGDEAANDLAARAATFLDPAKELNTVEEVLAGVGHLIAETFGEHVELRGRLRKIFHRTGKLVCAKVETPAEAPKAEVAAETPAESLTDETSAEDSAPVDDTAPVATAEQPEAEVAPPEEEVGAESAAAVSTDEPVTDAVEEPAEASAETAAAEAAPADGAAPALPVGRLFQKPAERIASPELKKKKKKKKKVSENAFKDYFNFSEAVAKVPPHRVLALNRGERARALRVRIEADHEAMFREADQLLINPRSIHAEYLRNCLRDALQRLIIPSLEREIRRELTDKAEFHAVDVFIRNLRKLLLQPPVRGKRVLAVDPGFKSGCKLAALDEFGNVLGHGVVFVIGKDDRLAKSRHRIAEMVKLHRVSVITIGNGTGCREAEQLVAELLSNELKDYDCSYCVVNEAGASIYSTSPLGREELPQHDPLQRGAISIGRRLLDPLSELVKINPANIGVGLYQHDLKAKHLKESLDAVVESCVNFVGVDVNSASPALLRYVSGMNQLTARRVYEYRREHGPFRTREELKSVPGFGDATYVQAAGFLKVLGGDNPLDATWIHPESYDLARQVLSRLGSDLDELAKTVPAPLIPQKPQRTFFGLPLEELTVDATTKPEDAVAGSAAEAVELEVAPAPEGEVTAAADAPAAEAPPVETPVVETPAAETPAVEVPAEDKGPSPSEAAAAIRAALLDRAGQLNGEQLAQELAVGPHLLRDVVQSLTRPGLDPRDNLPPPVFRRGIMKLEDLQAGMELSGTVLNVVDFGAFVDIGLTDSGLVHISRLADRFIRDPHEVVSVGDILKVWVIDVDKGRRRVSLTAIQPGSEKPQPAPRERRPEQQQQRPPRPPKPAGAPAGGPPPQGNRPPRPQRPQQGGRGDRRGGHGAPPPPKVIERQPTKPKVVKPITKKMEEGKEAMRSFSDLMQFLDKKKDKPDDKK